MATKEEVMQQRQTQIIILNWNSSAATVACLRSLIPVRDVRVVVWDNASTDDSIALLESTLHALPGRCNCIASTELTKNQLTHNWLLIRHNANIGFAAAVNHVLRALLVAKDCTHVWLLNNDALANPDTLDRLHAALTKKANTGFAGSVILDYHNRDLIQCCGMKYYRWLGVGKLMLKNQSWSSTNNDRLQKIHPDFQHGASLLVSMAAIRAIGLMDDRFFLYSEEHDWQLRGAKAGWGHALATDSVVYHMGSMSTQGQKHLFFYYYTKASVILLRKHQPWYTVLIASVCCLSIQAVRTRMKPQLFSWALKGWIEGWSVSVNPGIS